MVLFLRSVYALIEETRSRRAGRRERIESTPGFVISKAASQGSSFYWFVVT
jgi:hypothetical protein